MLFPMADFGADFGTDFGADRVVEVLVLDGGMGRELERMGAPFRQPEWSALALIEDPESVARAHRNFIGAGAQVITTNSYACVPFHLGQERFVAEGSALATRAGQLARAVADECGGSVRVAGSLPPVLGSYRPDLFDVTLAEPIVSMLTAALHPYVDLWLIETTSSIPEANLWLNAIQPYRHRETWLSFTLADELVEDCAVLRSGERVTDAVRATDDRVTAILFNCSPPEVMEAALLEAQATAPHLVLGAYANAFEQDEADAGANETLHGIRSDLGPDSYAEVATRWVGAGASIVGGCCGISPDHISRLRHTFRN
jgi:S-methylmethionine-dependent homocysteine/selenocysteine methylase